jgi:hypothetical protein
MRDGQTSEVFTSVGKVLRKDGGREMQSIRAIAIRYIIVSTLCSCGSRCFFNAKEKCVKKKIQSPKLTVFPLILDCQRRTTTSMSSK